MVRSAVDSFYTVSQQNDTDVAYYNFNAHQQISVIFGRDAVEIVRYRIMICYPTFPTNVSALPWEI